MSKKVIPGSSNELLLAVETLALQKARVSGELGTHTVLVSSGDPLIVNDVRQYLPLAGDTTSLERCSTRSDVPSDMRAPPAKGGKSVGGTGMASMILPPSMALRNNEYTPALSDAVQYPSLEYSTFQEADALQSLAPTLFQHVYATLLNLDPEDPITIPHGVSFSLASLRLSLTLPYLAARLPYFSISTYFKGNSDLFGSPLEALTTSKEKSTLLFGLLNGGDKYCLPLVNYKRAEPPQEEEQTGSQEKSEVPQVCKPAPFPTDPHACSYYYLMQQVKIHEGEATYTADLHWASMLAMGMDCSPNDPYSFLISPFSRFNRLKLTLGAVDANTVRIFLSNFSPTPSNVLSFFEFPTLFGVLRDRYRQHFLRSQNVGVRRSPLFHRLIDDFSLNEGADEMHTANPRGQCSYTSQETAPDGGQDKIYSLRLARSSLADEASSPRDVYNPSSQARSDEAPTSIFLLDLFEETIAKETTLQYPLSLGILDVLVMDESEYSRKQYFDRHMVTTGSRQRNTTCSQEQRTQDSHPCDFDEIESFAASIRQPSPSLFGRSPNRMKALRSILHHEALGDSMDSSPFDTLEEFNIDQIFVKLSTPDPILSILLTDDLDEHEQDFVQTYAVERQLKLYRLLERKYPARYNIGRYNVGSTEGATMFGPILINPGLGTNSSVSGLSSSRALMQGSATGEGMHTRLGMGSFYDPHGTMTLGKHLGAPSIHTTKTNKTRMTSKAATAHKALVKLQRMRQSVSLANQSYLPGHKLVLFKPFDPANFPAGLPPSPWNDDETKKTVDILKLGVDELRAMKRDDVIAALDEQERLMRTTSLLTKLQVRGTTSSSQDLPSTRGEPLEDIPEGGPGAEQSEAPLNLPREPSSLDAPEVLLKPAKTPTVGKAKGREIRGYKVIDETVLKPRKRVYEEVYCDAGDDDLYEEDDTVRLDYCVMRLSTLLELCSSVLIFNLESLPEPVCAKVPPTPNYPTRSPVPKGKNVPSSSSLSGEKRESSPSPVFSYQAPNFTPLWKNEQITLLGNDTKNAEVASTTAPGKSPAPKAPKKPDPKSSSQPEKEPQRPQPSVTLQLNTLTNGMTVIGEKEKDYNPALRHVVLNTMAPTTRYYTLVAVLSRKGGDNASTGMLSDGSTHLRRNTSNINAADGVVPHEELPNDLSKLGMDSQRANDFDGESISLEEHLSSPGRQQPSRVPHQVLREDCWLQNESLFLTFQASYLPVLADDNEPPRVNSEVVDYFDVSLYFVHEGRLYVQAYRDLTTISIDIIREFLMHTGPMVPLTDGRTVTITIFLSVSVHSAVQPYPASLMARPGARVGEEQPAVSNTDENAPDDHRFWLVDPGLANQRVAYSQGSVDFIAGRFQPELLPMTQHAPGATVTVTALCRNTDQTEICALSLEPYAYRTSDKDTLLFGGLVVGEGDPSKEIFKDGRFRFVRSCIYQTQGVPKGSSGVVAIFRISNQQFLTEDAPEVEPVIEAVEETGTSSPRTTLRPQTAQRQASLVRLLPTFASGIPMGATLFIYALDDSSNFVLPRTPISANGYLLNATVDFLLAPSSSVFIVVDGFSNFVGEQDPKAKAPVPSGLQSFDLEMCVLADDLVDIAPFQINSETYVTQKRHDLEVSDKATVELQFSIPKGYCFIDLQLYATPASPSIEASDTCENAKEVGASEEQGKTEGEIAPEMASVLSLAHQALPTVISSQSILTDERDVIPITIFEKPVLPVFEEVSAKGQAQARSKTPVLATTHSDAQPKDDIVEVMSGMSAAVRECTTELVPTLCSGCFAGDRRVFICKIPESGVLALNMFLPEAIAPQYASASYSFLAFTFAAPSDLERPATPGTTKGQKTNEPVPNTLVMTLSTLDNWILQHLCTSIWSKDRVIQSEALAAKATYLQGLNIHTSLTAMAGYSFVPSDELVTYLKQRAESATAVQSGKKTPGSTAKGKNVEQVGPTTINPRELVEQRVRAQTGSDLLQIVKTEMTNLQSCVVTLGKREVDTADKKQRKTESKRATPVPEGSKMLESFQQTLAARTTEPDIKYFEVELVRQGAGSRSTQRLAFDQEGSDRAQEGEHTQ
ncbi:hypothetical protein GMRT_13938 [Giardia muris]|uniref:Uncharacterized protein n=1 Tax=Giardia muris TaxID=5742 RepID=A0A4Z1SS49_GIAMU|nr:hypothetical protein GMRT_13938 [Giardia muris]|eukprot:TNJ26478.1 hypothetical protein GMRT_13938 [Giardia muris]